MPTDLVTVQLKRDTNAEQWGFNLSGGKDQGSLLTISEIKTGSIAEKLGLKVRDVILKINDDSASEVTSQQAEEFVKKGENQFVMVIERSEDIVEDPRYEGLDEVDRARVGNNDVTKPTLRRDWNCPWVKRDGKGLKKVVRNIFGTDPTPAPVKTSQHHFYSEPGSILAPEGPPIDLKEIERTIAEKIRQEEIAKHPDGIPPELQESAQNEVPVQQVKEEPPVAQQQNQVMSPEPSFQSPQPHHERNGVEEEEDLSCPPDLEEVSESVQAQPEITEQNIAALPINFNPSIVRELTLAIKESMQNYQDMGDNYEPSADELIDVLKNLENLAAVNPALYRAIVDQIKVNNSHLDGQPDQVEQGGSYDEVEQEQQQESQPMEVVAEPAPAAADMLNNPEDQVDFRNGSTNVTETEMVSQEVL